MALIKLKDFNRNHGISFGEYNVLGFSVYRRKAAEKIGVIKDILIDQEEERFLYFVVDLGFLNFGKKVLLPVNRSRINFKERCIYIKALRPAPVAKEPEVNKDLTPKFVQPVQQSIEIAEEPKVEKDTIPQLAHASFSRLNFAYSLQPTLYGLADQNCQTIQQSVRSAGI